MAPPQTRSVWLLFLVFANLTILVECFRLLHSTTTSLSRVLGPSRPSTTASTLLRSTISIGSVSVNQNNRPYQEIYIEETLDPNHLECPIYESTTPTDDKSDVALTTSERLGRALSFYQTAIPVFLSYQALDMYVKFQREKLGKEITPEAEEAEYQKLHEWGSVLIAAKINELKGFYVKTGQIISTRVDIFPEQYTSKLAMMQDSLDPLPADVIKDIVKKDLLEGADLSDLFAEFDDTPLGSASIAQVHRAKLLDGRVVAVKVQRPGVEPKLLGDIANLKNFAYVVRELLPVDYYKVFSELERSLIYELDFLHEAQATAKVAAAVAHSPSNKPTDPPVVVPLPIPGLVSKKVMVMEYVDGVALSKMAAEMAKRNVKAGSPEATLLGRKLLSSLTDAYANMIFGSGIVHGDPHPGNIFILEEGEVALLDCGQVKVLTTPQRLGLARLVIMVNDWELADTRLRALKSDPSSPLQMVQNAHAEVTMLTKRLAETVRSFGIFFKEGAGDECAAAVAILLFGNTNAKLPGGYVGEEISKDSPIAQVAEFPSEFILMGRATVMIKGIANRLGVAWGLSDRWSSKAREILSASSPKEVLPIWSVAVPSVASTQPTLFLRKEGNKSQISFKDICNAFVSWTKFLKQYLVEKTVRVIKKNVSQDSMRKLLSLYLRLEGMFSKQKKSPAVVKT